MGFLARLHGLSDFALLALRLGVGSIFIVHGTHKRKFWKMQPSAQLPSGMLKTLRLLSIAEPLGGLAVLVGFLTQPAALGLAFVMLGALRFLITQVHRKFTGDNVAGWEFEFLLLLSAIVLLFVGAGRYSLDWMFFHI